MTTFLRTFWLAVWAIALTFWPALLAGKPGHLPWWAVWVATTAWLRVAGPVLHVAWSQVLDSSDPERRE